MPSLQIGTVRGRMYDVHGRCNTPHNKLVAKVTPGEAKATWEVTVTFEKCGPHPFRYSYVTIEIEANAIEKPHESPVRASGILYDSETTEVLVGADMLPALSSDGTVLRQAPIAAAGRFTGARIMRDNLEPYIRVDHEDVLAFWLEVPFTVIQ